MKIIKCLSEGVNFSKDMVALAQEYTNILIDALNTYGVKALKPMDANRTKFAIAANYKVEYIPQGKAFTSKGNLHQHAEDEDFIPEIFPDHFPPFCVYIVDKKEREAAFSSVKQEILLPISKAGIAEARRDLKKRTGSTNPTLEETIRHALQMQLSFNRRGVLSKIISHELTHWFDLGRWETADKLVARADNKKRKELDYALPLAKHMNADIMDAAASGKTITYFNSDTEVVAATQEVIKNLSRFNSPLTKERWDKIIMEHLRAMEGWEYYTASNKQRIAKEVYKYLTSGDGK